jgi:hypothetical protein
MLYNWSSIYQRLITSGQDFDQLTPVISIWLLGFNLLNNPAFMTHSPARSTPRPSRSRAIGSLSLSPRQRRTCSHWSRPKLRIDLGGEGA